MKQIIASVCIFFACTSFLSATESLSVQSINLGGHFLGGLSAFGQADKQQSQFDLAYNLDVAVVFNERLKSFAQFQSGSGGGFLGYVGPESVLTDVGIDYTLKRLPGVITFGSFDTPFGLQTEGLTNNADTSGSPFILNDLFYSYFGGEVGTLNTIGIKYVHDLGKETQLTVSLTNGTSENSVNEGNNPEILLGLRQILLNGRWTVGTSYLHSDDSDDVNNPDSGSFNTKTTLWIVDNIIQLNGEWQFANYIGAGTFNDDNAATKDNVLFAMLGLTQETYNYKAGYRVSLWQPEDNDGNGNGFSAQLQPGGLDHLVNGLNPIDTQVIRHQFGFALHLDDGVTLNTDLIIENYGDGDDITTILAYVMGAF